MKRDLDLIRYVLITAEVADCPITDSELINAKYSFEEVAFHVELLADKGLIVASVDYDGFGQTPLGLELKRITWEGYDYLDAIRSRKVWDKAKEAIANSVGDTSLSVVKETCQLVAQSLIKQQLGM